MSLDPRVEHLYPKTAVPTESLVIADLQSDRMDGQIAACVLQGIVNREAPVKAYVFNTYCFDNKGGGANQARVAEKWLTEVYADLPQERLALGGGPNPGFRALLERFGDVVKGWIVYDPRLEDATIEAATTIAGQTDGVVVSPELLDELKPLALPVLADLRDPAFADNVACLTWLKENWFAGASHQVAFTWRMVGTGEKSWGAANKDYVVANRLFTFSLDVSKAEESQRYAEILFEYPPGTPVMGWSDEMWADALFNRLGYFMVPCISVENLTVHASFPSTSMVAPEPKVLPLDPGAVYLAFFVADGDNLLHSLVYEPDTLLTSRDVGSVPTTWVINPALVDLAPRVFDWYRARLLADASMEQELAGMMGDGHPGSDQFAGFRFYCDLARHYVEKAGLRTLKQMGESEAVAWRVRPYVVNGGYAGTDARGPRPYEFHADDETFHIGSVHIREQDLQRVIREASENEPLFLEVFSGTGSMDTPAHIREVADELRAADLGRPIHLGRTMDLAATYHALRAK